MMNYPPTLKVSDLNRMHPVYVENQPEWVDLGLLARGGYKLKRQANRFLQQKPREPMEVYNFRIRRFTAQNIIGPVLRWYRAALMSCAYEIRVGDDSVLSEWLSKFLDNCGAPEATEPVSFDQHVGDCLDDFLLYGVTYTLIDNPAAEIDEVEPVKSLADQRARGLLDPYLVRFSPLSVIDWAEDDKGELEYIVIKCENEARQFAGDSKLETSWLIYDDQNFAKYTATSDPKDKDPEAKLVDTGRHALADQRQVPIVRRTAREAQWLGDRAILSTVSHVEMLNAQDWGTFNALLAMLVIKGDMKDQPKRSEVAYLNLPVDGNAFYLAPDPGLFATSNTLLQNRLEEAYRQMHVQAQARTAHATPAAQSGVSKQMDMAAATDVLNDYGGVLRGLSYGIVNMVLAARGDDASALTVNGWIFDEPTNIEILDEAERIDALGMPSKVFWRESLKRIARKALPGASNDVQVGVDKEIEAAEPPQMANQTLGSVNPALTLMRAGSLRGFGK